MVVVDNSEGVIKITKIDSNNLLGYKLKIQLENKSDPAISYAIKKAPAK